MFDYEYIGNLHIHTSHSDGALSAAEIAGAASRAGLNFIGINDHDFWLDSLPIQDEGYYGDVLVLVGLEIGERFHHYLAYDIEKIVKGDNLGPQEVIDGVNQQDGFGFLAHPFEKGMPLNERFVAFTWNDLAVQGYTGISIWNFMSRWKERIRSPFHGIYCLMFKRQSLKGPSLDTISFWDKMNQERRVVAIGGSDAHGTLFSWGPIKFRPINYDKLMTTVNIHIHLNRPMSKDFEEAKSKVYDAIKNGRLFIAHDGLCPAKGFKFIFISEDGSDMIQGEEELFNRGDLVVELPSEGEIRLIKDGKLEKVWQGTEAAYHVTEPGVYRIEVYRHVLLFGWKPWIFSNPIYLRESEDLLE